MSVIKLGSSSSVMQHGSCGQLALRTYTEKRGTYPGMCLPGTEMCTRVLQGAEWVGGSCRKNRSIFLQHFTDVKCITMLGQFQNSN